MLGIFRLDAKIPMAYSKRSSEYSHGLGTNLKEASSLLL